MSIWCDWGLHAWAYRTFVEHRIIDGPPPTFARLTCKRCGESRESRDSGDVARAKKAERLAWEKGSAGE